MTQNSSCILESKERSYEETELYEKETGISIQFIKPWKPNTGTYGIRFEGDNQYVHLLDQEMRIFIPFDGCDEKCWVCGGFRTLIVYLDLDGEFIYANDSCGKRRLGDNVSYD